MSAAGYDERGWDTSLPETSIEELLECVHILWRLSGCVDKIEAYKFIDKFLFSENDELEGVVPVDIIRDGEGLVILEYLREVEAGHKGLS
jgi:hypothetical protein